MRLSSNVRRVAKEIEYFPKTIRISGDDDFLHLLTNNSKPPHIDIGDKKILINDANRICALNILCREKFPENNFDIPTIYFSRKNEYSDESESVLYFHDINTYVSENGAWKTDITEKYLSNILTLFQKILECLEIEIESSFKINVGMNIITYPYFQSLAKISQTRIPVATIIPQLLIKHINEINSLPGVGTKIYVHWKDIPFNSKIASENLRYAEENNIKIIYYTHSSAKIVSETFYEIENGDFSKLVEDIIKYFDEKYPRTSIYIPNSDFAEWITNGTDNLILAGKIFPVKTTYSQGEHLLALIEKPPERRIDCKILYYCICQHHIPGLPYGNQMERNFLMAFFITGALRELLIQICDELKITDELFDVNFGNRIYSFSRKKGINIVEDEELSDKIYVVLTSWNKMEAFKKLEHAKDYVNLNSGIIKILNLS